MWNKKRADAQRNGGFARWVTTSVVLAVVGIGAIAAGAMAASRGHASPSSGGTTTQHHTAGATDRPHAKRSDSVVLQVQDLPDRPELGDWAVVQPDDSGSALACVPARVTDGLGAQSSLERRFAARNATAGDTPQYDARIGETVLTFSDSAAAVDAMQSVASWLQDCAGPDLVKHEFLASETVEGPGGGGFWETLLRSAQDVCDGTDCDAIWFDREALLHVGDRLVLVSMAEVGGPVEPDGLAASMHDIVDTAIRAAG
jgi:hypothetical protein